MEEIRGSTSITTASAATNHHALPIHTTKPMPQTTFNRIFALIYACAIISLLYFHLKTLIYSATSVSFFLTLILFISDLVFTFMWLNTQAFRMKPIYRQEFIENLQKIMKRNDFPTLDIFICTADPYKEPPISVVNTALSVMGYDYPKEKISVYVSDDGGSVLTLFALMEAAKFACHWLPFCEENNVVERSPEAYFKSNQPFSSETEKIKTMYESMKYKIENVVERGKIEDDYISGPQDLQVFSKWTDKFTKFDHPTIIQVLLDKSKDKGINGNQMPNFIYVSREKKKTTHHHFKAGALNVLLRVSASMTNAPIILTQDCDMYSNDPQTPLRALCYLCDPNLEFRSCLAYVQFPQRFHGINKTDIYAVAFRRLFEIQAMGMDGLRGPNYVGTGCFFSRRALFGGPSKPVQPEVAEINPNHIVDKPIQSESILSLAHQVASCDYENMTRWGSKMGFRYGSLVEDFFTGYRLECEGWKGIFCNPKRTAFFGHAPTTLIDLLNQQKRWAVGLLEVAFSKYNPFSFGVKSMGLLMSLGYAQYSYWPIWSFPIMVYAFLPQLALLNKIYIFPKASEWPWSLIYIFLFLGAYGQDCIDFLSVGGSFQAWLNDQRIWLIRGLTSHLFGSIEFLLKTLKISSSAFNLTSKTEDDEVNKRYEQGIFEFGVHSPLFVSLTTAALMSMISLFHGIFQVFSDDGNLEEPFWQILISGFGVLNCWPIYEAIALRSDSGKMPLKTTIVATFWVCCLYLVASIILHV